MRRSFYVIIIMAVAMAFSGCSKSNDTVSHAAKKNAVAQVIEEQTATEAEESSQSSTEEATVSSDPIAEKIISENSVDYDLTVMGADMVYATVYRMMMEPADFVGKTVKMRGLYYNSYYEPNNKYYNYCIIKDALACCSQGLEFVCSDADAASLSDNEEVTVTGTFETYSEDGSLYCHIADAKIDK